MFNPAAYRMATFSSLLNLCTLAPYQQVAAYRLHFYFFFLHTPENCNVSILLIS